MHTCFYVHELRRENSTTYGRHLVNSTQDLVNTFSHMSKCENYEVERQRHSKQSTTLSNAHFLPYTLSRLSLQSSLVPTLEPRGQTPPPSPPLTPTPSSTRPPLAPPPPRGACSPHNWRSSITHSLTCSW